MEKGTARGGLVFIVRALGAEDQSRWMVEVATSHNSYVRSCGSTSVCPGLALVLAAFMAAAAQDFPTRQTRQPAVSRGVTGIGCSRFTSDTFGFSLAG